LKAVIELEFIGDVPPHIRKWLAQVIRQSLRPWVARIAGLDSRWGLRREFVRPNVDYSRANSVGSRGVYGYYLLDDGIYEVSHPVSWRNHRRYFVRAAEGRIREIDREEVIECLKSGC
jgi:hypothetical protein